MSSEERFRYRPDPDVLARRLGEEIVLVHLKTNRMYSLNRTGARVWELLGEVQGNATETARRIREEFDGAPGPMETEVFELLETLVREEMLVREESP